LIVGAAVLWLLLGTLAGVLSALYPRTLADRAITMMALFFYSIPNFVLGLLLLLVLYYFLTIHGFPFFPAAGYVPFSTDPAQWMRHLLLPWFTLAAVSAAAYARLTRGSMLDVLGDDYVRTARSKGISERRVIFRHALRAAVTPTISQFGIDLGTAVGSVIVIEEVFGLPGLGYNAINAIQTQNLPLIIGITLVGSATVIMGSLLADILYALVDVRVRLN
jgi:peptide/nickel transport system permease protein